MGRPLPDESGAVMFWIRYWKRRWFPDAARFRGPLLDFDMAFPYKIFFAG